MAAFIGCLAAAGASAAGERLTENPYAPAYGHAYRHGAVPTREAAQRMRAWEAVRHVLGLPAFLGLPGLNTLSYGGGIDGIGTGGEMWSGTMTQYCDGPTVPAGATTCNPSSTPHVGYPSSGALAGVWFDTAAPSPSRATAAQLAQEAVNAAAHFGNTTPGANRYAQYVVVSPSGTHPDGFNTPTSAFCAWHDYTSSSYGDIAYTNMPYVTDLGTSCGENFVNPGSAGLLDGFSIVNGHEYAETVTDQNPPGGWTSLLGQENGDECAWISSGQGAAANVSMGNGAYAMQSTWSNDTNECDISHPIL